MRKLFHDRISKVFSRQTSKSENEDLRLTNHLRNDPYMSGRPLPFNWRRMGYDDVSGAAHFGFPYYDERSLRFSDQTRSFIETITPTGLSHLLIWYLFHDIVPKIEQSENRYTALKKSEMIGYIRLGYELSKADPAHLSSQLPRPLRDAIEYLRVDERDVIRRLIRLSKAEQMQEHELARYDFHDHQTSSYLAAGDKLESDRRLLQGCRPISKTIWADWQTHAWDWIEGFLDDVIRPEIDPSRPGRPPPESHPAEKDNDKETRRLFSSICGRHVDPPLESIYHDALATVNFFHARDVLLSRQSLLDRREHSWMERPSHGRTAQISYSSREELTRRRRSAPMLHRGDRDLLTIEERLDALREDFDTALDTRLTHHRASSRMGLLPDIPGRASRMGARFSQSRLRLQAAPASPSVQDSSSHYSSDDDRDVIEGPNGQVPNMAQRYSERASEEVFHSRDYRGPEGRMSTVRRHHKAQSRSDVVSRSQTNVEDKIGGWEGRRPMLDSAASRAGSMAQSSHSRHEVTDERESSNQFSDDEDMYHAALRDSKRKSQSGETRPSNYQRDDPELPERQAKLEKTIKDVVERADSIEPTQDRPDAEQFSNFSGIPRLGVRESARKSVSFAQGKDGAAPDFDSSAMGPAEPQGGPPANLKTSTSRAEDERPRSEQGASTSAPKKGKASRPIMDRKAGEMS